MIKRSILFLSLILALFPYIAGASQLRSDALGGIVPDAEMDVIQLNPALLYRLYGTKIIFNPSLIYSSSTFANDDYNRNNFSGGTNDISTTKNSEFDLTGSSLGLLYHKGSFGFGILLSPTTYYGKTIDTEDPNTLTNNIFDIKNITTIRKGKLYNGQLICNFSSSAFSLALKGGYINKYYSYDYAHFTNGIQDESQNNKYLMQESIYSTGCGMIFSDDKSKAVGLSVNISFGSGHDNQTPEWVPWILFANNYVIASNKYYILKKMSPFDIDSSIFADIRYGDNGLMRIVANLGYNTEKSTYDKSTMFLNAFTMLSNLSVSQESNCITPSASFSYIKNYDRTLTALGFGFDLKSSASKQNVNYSTKIDPTTTNRKYIDTSKDFLMSFDLKLAVETSALSWLVIRGSIVPTLFIYNSSSYSRVDSFDPVKMNVSSFTTKETANSYYLFFPEIKIISGATFKLSPKINLDIYSGLTVLTTSYASSKDEWAKQRPNYDSTKKSPIDTVKNFTFNLNVGLIITI